VSINKEQYLKVFLIYRHLITDEYDISFSSGFDFLKDKKVHREDVTIVINKIE